jgi:hypothetical protein
MLKSISMYEKDSKRIAQLEEELQKYKSELEQTKSSGNKIQVEYTVCYLYRNIRSLQVTN